MIVLGIESSCDETAVSLIKDGDTCLVNLISSQIKHHSKHGGVVPELASRLHAETIHFLIAKAFKESGLEKTDIDLIAVTEGPGLEGALLVGIAVAKTMAKVLNIPIVGVNHLKGHIYAHFLANKELTFPFLGLLVSGGHTQLLACRSHTEFEILGQTRDDAAGEAFDKSARILGLGYPGGPKIEEAAKLGDPKAYPFPIGLRQSASEFSFSGLKTAVKQTVEKLELTDAIRADVCASFQKAVGDALVKKLLKTSEATGLKTVVLCGGVMANKTLTKHLQEAALKEGITTHYIDPVLCTDNAAMIATAGYHQFKELGASENVFAQPGLAI